MPSILLKLGSAHLRLYSHSHQQCQRRPLTSDRLCKILTLCLKGFLMPLSASQQLRHSFNSRIAETFCMMTAYTDWTDVKRLFGTMTQNRPWLENISNRSDISMSWESTEQISEVNIKPKASYRSSNRRLFIQADTSSAKSGLPSIATYSTAHGSVQCIVSIYLFWTHSHHHPEKSCRSRLQVWFRSWYREWSVSKGSWLVVESIDPMRERADSTISQLSLSHGIDRFNNQPAPLWYKSSSIWESKSHL